MKIRTVYWTLLLLFFGATAGVNAQVAIGNQDEPHPAAVLDLKSSTQGLLLPNVALNMSDLTEFVLGEGTDKATAKGMIVYNTEDKKVYVWNGEKWNSMVNTGATATIPVTGVSILSSPASALTVGATHQLGCSVVPENATNRTVSWSSSVPSIATVDQTGKVTAQAIGSTTITVTTEDGDIPASIPIQVASSTPLITGYSPELPSVRVLANNSNVTFTINVANTAEELVYEWYRQDSWFEGMVTPPSSRNSATEEKIATTSSGTLIISLGTDNTGVKWIPTNCTYFYIYCVISLKSNPSVKVESGFFFLKGWPGGSCPS